MDTIQGNRASLETTCCVVVNWNLPDLTLRCVRALVADGLPAERIVIVDNGSDDGSAELLQRELPACRHARLPQNVGYARASNAGARELDADTYLFVNNDAFVNREGSVPRLLATLDLDGIGVAVPRLLNDDGTLQRNVVPLSTPVTALVRATGLSRFVPNRLQPRFSTHWNHSSSRCVDAANGAVLAVRGDVWSALGGYVERAWMFSEDLDICWRARTLGWKIWFAHDAEFIHLGNATGFENVARAELVALSDGQMIRSELGPVRGRATIGILCVGLLARGAVFAATGRLQTARWALASVRGYLKRPPAASASP
ncbi:MAG: glycosyltransferase family 2 protein [Actinomycetota bacterium]|nr:glycosyltransferase family 2 protein [Actinomycetota bacterium]